MATYKAVILSGDKFKKSDGKTNVKIRITHRGKQVYVATSFFVLPDEQFDRAQGLVKNTKDAKFINARLAEKILDFRKKDIELEERIDHMTSEDLRDYLTEKKQGNIDFIQYSESVIKKLRDHGKTKTADWHYCMMENLKVFVAKPSLDVLQINSHFLELFEIHLYKSGTKNRPLTPGGVNNYMRSFRSLFNQCRSEYNNEDTGKIRIPNYPFKKYSIPQVKRRNQGKSLTLDEMKKLIQFKPMFPRQQYAKDIFLLMFCLIGINSKDLFYLPKPTSQRIEFDRFKTGREYSIKMEPEVLRIVAKYQHNELFIDAMSRYSNQHEFMRNMNVALKSICKKLEIEKPISTNWARHTWATIARNDCKINKDDVALCLGHEDEDNKVTDTYIDYDYTIQDQCNRKVLNLVFGKNGRTAKKNIETNSR